MDKKDIYIIHPMNPLGNRIGGIATFLRGFVRYFPSQFSLHWIGITTDKNRFKTGTWHEISMGEKKIRFLPLFYVKDENRRKIFPLTLRFVLALYWARLGSVLSGGYLIFDRIECIFPFQKYCNKKHLFIHLDMRDLAEKKIEAKWKYFLAVYFFLEKLILPCVSKIYLVREDTALCMKETYPELENRISFVPTWVDEEIFKLSKLNNVQKINLKKSFGFSREQKLIVYVGRLELQKDPQLLLKVFSSFLEKKPDARLLIIGQGALEGGMRDFAFKSGIKDKIIFLGILEQYRIAEVFSLSDAFLLTSVTEGMPRSVLEALASGLPVVATDVGEVKRVVENGFSGEVVKSREVEEIANSLLKVLNHPEKYSPLNCLKKVEPFKAATVLKGVYSHILEED